LDRVDGNLPHSVEGAAIVILALPQDQVHDTLQFIAPDLQEDAVVMDTAPVKADVLQWAKDLLPPQRHYVGLTPVLNPAYLETPGSGVEAARADLFKHGLMAIVSPPGTPYEAVKLAADFSRLLGAEHLFIDPLEHDSMMSATHVLPQLISAALLNATVDQPGWRDTRKLADRSYAAITNASAQYDQPGALTRQALASQVHLLRWMDAFIDNLDAIRQQLAADDTDKLQEALTRARSGREKWLKEKNSLSWAAAEQGANVELPTARQVFTRMFTFGGGRKPKPPDKSQ
jgi:prephenate dehydrogenase